MATDMYQAAGRDSLNCSANRAPNVAVHRREASFTIILGTQQRDEVKVSADVWKLDIEGAALPLH